MRQIQLTLEQKDKTVITLMLLVIMVVGFFWYLNNRTPDVVNYPPANTSIIAFGDSLVAGVGSTDSDGFITRLEMLINRDIQVFGFSGFTSAEGLEVIDEVTERSAGIVIVSLGGNDRIQRIERDRVYRNMSKVISKLQNAGSAVVLIETPGYGNLYKDLARDHKAMVVTQALAPLMRDPRLMSDLIHPNDAGYIKMAERIAPTVQKILQ